MNEVETFKDKKAFILLILLQVYMNDSIQAYHKSLGSQIPFWVPLFEDENVRLTYIVSPCDIVKRRIGLDMALKIDIRSLEDVFRVQAATKGYNSPRYICKRRGRKEVIKNRMDFRFYSLALQTWLVSMQTVMISDSFSGKLKIPFASVRVNLLSNLQWTLIMYPSSLTRSGKYSLVALQTMYFPLSSGLATNLMTDEVHSSCPLLSSASLESEVVAEATSNSRLSMNQRKRGIGREPWHRHSNVDSLPAEKALLRSPVIVTAKGGTEKQEKKWINFNNFFAHNIEFNLALSTRLEMALLSRF